MLYISFLVPNLVLLIEFALVPLFLNFYFRNYLFTNRVQHGLFGHIQRTYRSVDKYSILDNER
jgi:hypothetical protein